MAHRSSLRQRCREGDRRRAAPVSGSLQPNRTETKHLRKDAAGDGNPTLTNQANLQFVLDANVFITAHRNYYPFDLCPGFWECLIRHFLGGKLLSIDKVRDELLDTSKSEDEEPDALYSWAKDSPEGLFASSSDQAVVNAFGDVIAWVRHHPQFSRGAKDDFARKADGWLVAYAKAFDLTIVTQEVSNPDIKSRVPIPNVCNHFNVDYLNTFDMLRQLDIRFELASSP